MADTIPANISPLYPLANAKGTDLLCELCQKPAFIQCSKCRVTYYCGQEHQRADWVGIHAKICDDLAALRKPAPFLTSEKDRREKREEVAQQQLRMMNITRTTGQKLLFENRFEEAVPAALQSLKFAIDVHGSASVELVPSYLILGEASIGLQRFSQVQLLSGDLECLVRVRNPWGNEEEWKGSWGDDTAEWEQLGEDEKRRIGLSSDDDGEFWMSFEDFAANFHKVEICNLGPDSLSAEGAGGKTRWEAISHHGSWKRNVNAGGCRKYLDTFWLNPQFRVRVVDPDEDDDEDLGSIIIGLMQKNMRKQGAANHFIGYILYQTDASDPPGPKELNFFKYKASAARSPSFGDSREITGRHRLAPGTYVVVPSTFDPNLEAEFLLRIYSEQPSESDEVDDVVTVPEDISIGNDALVANGNALSEAASEHEKQLEAAACKAFGVLTDESPGFLVDDLMQILNMAFTKSGPKGFQGFSKEACRSLLAFVDDDQSGYLQFEEFRTLWRCLRLWSAVFKAFDADKSGDFNSFELRAALACIGYRVPNRIYQSLVMRYADKSGTIKFDDFVILCVRLKTILESFRAQSEGPEAQVAFGLDDFLQLAMYN